MPTTLSGTVESVFYTSPDGGWSVIRLTLTGLSACVPAQAGASVNLLAETAMVVGPLPAMQGGESIEVTGQWTTHPKFGQQFKAQSCVVNLPTTRDGLIAYLGSGMVKYIGPDTARRIVAEFGLETLDVLDNHIERLVQVWGIAEARAGQIAGEWEKQKAIRHVMMFLAGLGITPGLAAKIHKQYGDASISVIQADPYRLAQDIHGVGFKTADQIAVSLGLPHDGPERIGAGVLYALDQLAVEGHTCAPKEMLITKAAELLEVSPDLVVPQLGGLQARYNIVMETIPLIGSANSGDGSSVTAVYAASLYRAETQAAQSLHQIAGVVSGSALRPFQAVDWTQAFEGMEGVELTDQQREAAQTALTSKVTVLTGGPGTGKTTCLRAVLDLTDAYGVSYELCSPTGRAAKRMAEATGRNARTIHRLLEYSPGEGGFQRNADKPLSADLIVADEASMLDISLARHLFAAIPPTSHLLLVGDVDQLPSVGPGNVLRDIIDSGRASVVRLGLIFRQAEGSFIIANAHRINQGEFPALPQTQDGDFFFFGEDDPAKAAALIVDLVGERIPNKFGIEASDIQVLAPMRRGEVGVENLNALLQAALNPPSPGKAEHKVGATTFRVGDRVMQIRNNYDHDVFNGDIGVVDSIDDEEQTLTVSFDGRAVEYDWGDCDELVLAYAATIHKAQGSEYPCVVMPLMTQHYMMLQRNLLYTGVTRAKKLVVIVGTKKALAMAVKNAKTRQRYSGLRARLAA
jgi:exodeoxyribonuclease V alpha subunit